MKNLYCQIKSISFYFMLISILAIQFSSNELSAEDVCKEFYGKGYCTDYVNKRTGMKQRGDAKKWPSNLPRSEVRRGDVAIFKSKNHVAYVEKVLERDSKGNPTKIRISEMNWGRGYRPGTPKECVVTSKFGIKTERDIAVSKATYLRPGGYTKPSSKSNKQQSKACKDKEKLIKKAQRLVKRAKSHEKRANRYKDKALEYKNKGNDYLSSAKKSKSDREQERLKKKAKSALLRAKKSLERAKKYSDKGKAAKAEAKTVIDQARKAC